MYADRCPGAATSISGSLEQQLELCTSGVNQGDRLVIIAIILETVVSDSFSRHLGFLWVTLLGFSQQYTVRVELQQLVVSRHAEVFT